jgi:hypothetical protein
MADYLERRVSEAAAWSRRLATFSVVLFLTAGLGHRFGYLGTLDFIPVLGAVAGVAILALVFGARALSQLWKYGGEGSGNLIAGVLVSLLVLTPFALSGYRAMTHPMLNDVSTDTDDPPELASAGKLRTADMNPIEPITPERRKLQQESYPSATGRRYGAPIGQVVEVVADVLDGRGWPIISPTERSAEATEITIEALASSFLLGFPADVAVRLIDEGTSTYVDMRSASRYGEHDLGDNAARIAAFLADLDVEIAYLTVVAPVEPAEEPPEPKPALPDAVEVVPVEPPAEPLDRSEDPPD